jgi:hypothetical protein
MAICIQAIGLARYKLFKAQRGKQNRLDQLTKDATSALAAGADPRQVIRQMRL